MFTPEVLLRRVSTVDLTRQLLDFAGYKRKKRITDLRGVGSDRKGNDD